MQYYIILYFNNNTIVDFCLYDICCLYLSILLIMYCDVCDVCSVCNVWNVRDASDACMVLVTLFSRRFLWLWIHEMAVLVVKKKLQFSSNGPPFYLVCSRPLFSAVGLHCLRLLEIIVSYRMLRWWCPAICWAKCLVFLHGSVLELEAVDMVRLQLLRGNDHRNPSQQVVTWRWSMSLLFCFVLVWHLLYFEEFVCSVQ